MVKYDFNVQGKERKSLIDIIAETLGETAEYQKPPTYAYKIGENFTVTREGVLEISEIDEERITAVLNALKEAGYEYDESGNLTIAMPLDGFSTETLDNLHKMVQSKAPLIRKALGLCNEQELSKLPIVQTENALEFPWFPLGTCEETYAYTQFITALCNTAKTKKRVTAKAPESFENEKFAMRVFCIGLGLVGKEYTLCRKLMMNNLSGNSSWRYSEDEAKPRKERVHKDVISIRLTSDILDKIAIIAKQSGMSRNALIESMVLEHIQEETAE
jgi:hypothetical protein